MIHDIWFMIRFNPKMIWDEVISWLAHPKLLIFTAKHGTKVKGGKNLKLLTVTGKSLANELGCGPIATDLWEKMISDSSFQVVFRKGWMWICWCSNSETQPERSVYMSKKWGIISPVLLAKSILLVFTPHVVVYIGQTHFWNGPGGTWHCCPYDHCSKRQPGALVDVNFGRHLLTDLRRRSGKQTGEIQ